jgi:hypothetical protein
LKAEKEKQHLTYKGKTIQMAVISHQKAQTPEGSE